MKQHDEETIALAKAVADSRIVRNGVVRCAWCGRSFGSGGKTHGIKVDARKALRIHLLQVADCNKLMLREGRCQTIHAGPSR